MSRNKTAFYVFRSNHYMPDDFTFFASGLAEGLGQTDIVRPNVEDAMGDEFRVLTIGPIGNSRDATHRITCQRITKPLDEDEAKEVMFSNGTEFVFVSQGVGG